MAARDRSLSRGSKWVRALPAKYQLVDSLTGSFFCVLILSSLRLFPFAFYMDLCYHISIHRAALPDRKEW
jgi:hypothetical protein